MVPDNADHPLGAYGFRLLLDGQERHASDLIPVDADAPAVRVVTRLASFARDHDEVSEDRVILGYRGGSGFTVHREPAVIELDMPRDLPQGSLVHPVLTGPISVLCRWSNALTLHAGAYEAGGRAWAVLGEREAGKSTMLASMAERGCPVVADDLLVIDDAVVRAGPHCVDLRPDAAARFAGSRLLGEVGGRDRHRLSTPVGEPRVPLGGFLSLGWHQSSEVIVERVPTSDLLERIYGQEYIGLMGPADPRRILDLLGTPAWRVLRPRDWDRTDATCRRLLALAQD